MGRNCPMRTRNTSSKLQPRTTAIKNEGLGFDRRFEMGDPFLGEPYDIKTAIVAFGPEAEDAVLERLAPKNVAIYGVMCNILKEIGTEKSIPVLEELATKNLAVRGFANAAIQSIRSRER
jgi:hypothetical protein